MSIATTAPDRTTAEPPTTGPSVRTPAARSKLLVVLVVIVAGVGILAMMTGMPWSEANGAATGVRLEADSGQGATLSVSELEPGDSTSKTVTIRNSGAADSRLSFEENAVPATFADGKLHLRIEQDGRTVYDGPFGGMNDVAQDVGNLPPGGSSKFTFTVSLPSSAPFANQGDPAVATYTWVTAETTTG
jgi:hypothetical protein